MALEYIQGSSLASQRELQGFWHNVVTLVHELSQLVGQRRLHHSYHRRCNNGSSRYLKCFVTSLMLVCSSQDMYLKVACVQCKITETGYFQSLHDASYDNGVSIAQCSYVQTYTSTNFKLFTFTEYKLTIMILLEDCTKPFRISLKCYFRLIPVCARPSSG